MKWPTGVRYGFIPDLHAPAIAWAAFNRVIEFYKENRPEVLVLLGDVIDAWLMATYTKSERMLMSTATAKRELRDLRKVLATVAPLADRVVYIPGNHEERVFKRIAEIPWLSEYVETPFEKLCEEFDIEFTPGAILLPNPGRKQIYVHHGHASVANVEGVSIVQGHDHQQWLVWRNKDLWKMSCGYLSQPQHACFKYRGASAAKGFTKWKHGHAIVDQNGDPWTMPV